MTKQAFTLTELLIVMIVIGIMVAWGTPQYGRTIERARARNAINNLIMIHAANLVYQARHGGNNCTADSACTDLNKINGINGANSLNLIAGGVTYACADGGTDCTGTSDSGKFTVTVDLTSPIVQDSNPVCDNTDASYKACP